MSLTEMKALLGLIVDLALENEKFFMMWLEGVEI
jgi:hypothetical protein